MSYQQPLWYACLWKTARGKKILKARLRRRVKRLIEEISHESGIKLDKSIVYQNGVYIEMELSPRVAPHKIVRLIKFKTASAVRSEFDEAKKLPSLWTREHIISQKPLGMDVLSRILGLRQEVSRRARNRADH